MEADKVPLYDEDCDDDKPFFKRPRDIVPQRQRRRHRGQSKKRPADMDSLHGQVTMAPSSSSSLQVRNPHTGTVHQAAFEVQPIVPVRTEKHVTDSVCFYSQAALMTLLYANVTQGVSVPGLLDEDAQRL